MQKTCVKVEHAEVRWPTRVHFGKEGQMKNSYTRNQNPMKIQSARYRCKCYQSYKCTARLEIREIDWKDKYVLKGYHTQNCTAVNGVKAKQKEKQNQVLMILLFNSRSSVLR